MRHVELEATVRAARARQVFDAVTHWERYPELAPHVRTTTVHDAGAGGGSSSWELYFRSGLLRWTEEETFAPDALLIRFRQTEGDFEEFSGQWQLGQRDEDVTVRFEADFDFGIPSLEGILDPIAERVVKETVAWALRGLFASVDLSDPLELQDTPKG